MTDEQLTFAMNDIRKTVSSQLIRKAVYFDSKKADTTYKIVRLYREVDRESQVIQTGLTLEEAQAHCRDERTSTPEYFDGYMEE